MSFRADISTDVPVPQVQAPQATGDDVSDVLNVASFGLNLYSQYKKAESEKQRAERQAELMNQADKITESVFNAKSQKSLSAVEEQMLINKSLTQFSNPLERDFVSQRIGANLTTGVLAEAREEILTAEQAIDKDLRAIPVEMQAMVLEGQNIGQMSMDQKRTAINKYRKLAKLNADAEEAKDTLANNPNYRTLSGALSSDFQSRFGLLQTQLASLINQVDKAGDADAKLVLSQAKGNMVDHLNYMESQVDAMLTASIKNVTDKDVRSAMEKEAQLYKDSLKNYREQLNASDEEQFSRMAKVAKFLQDKSDVELAKSFPKMMKLKQAAGPAFNSVMQVLMTANPNIFTMTSDTIEASISELLGTTGGIASIANQLDLESLSTVISEGGLMQFAEKDRDQAAAAHWNAVSAYVKSPDAISKLGDEQINQLGISMVAVLDRADELGDSESLANASDLLASPAMKGVIDRLPEEQRSIVSNYVAKSSAEFLRRRLQDDSFLEYENGKLVSTLKPGAGTEAGEVGLGITSGIRADSRNTRIQRAVAESNAKLDNAAALLVKHQPAIENIQQAKDYIVGSFRPDLVPETDEQAELRKQAIEQNTTIQAIEERTALRTRVREFEADTRRAANPVQQASEASVNERQEEELRLLRALKATTDREERLAILEELDKLESQNAQ